jgi:glycosyltransferase involved in cell wall biosynthesis
MKPPLDIRFAAETVTHWSRVVRDRRRMTAGWFRRTRRWDVNVFLESLDRRYLPLAKVNWFFPNQEWLTSEDRDGMRGVDRVLFKTRHAEQTLASYAAQSSFVGFTSDDRRLPGSGKEWRRALHVAGWNPLKGTERLVQLWHQHPAWPLISVIAQQPSLVGAAHIRILAKTIDDARLRQLQNECGIHVAPSEIEGFGHTLNEGLSCGALLITTDAPPMNEVAGPAAIRVAVESTEPMASGTRYKFSPAALAEAVERIADMTDAERRPLSEAGRQTFEDRRQSFVARFQELIEAV